MRIILTQQRTILAVACALALGAFSVSVNAQDINENGLVKDLSGQQVMSGFGVCVHSGFGPAPSWTAGCHPRVVTPLAQYLEKTIPAPVAAVTAAAPPAVYETVGFASNVSFD